MNDMAKPVLDAETKVGERPHRRDVRLWLRLLTCANLVEALVRTRLRAEFGVTLPQFDLMAQLEKAPDGMTLGLLSRRMMVSNGNVTGLVERLVSQGQVSRSVLKEDRRAATVRLTEAGRAAFATMAAAHEGWLAEAFGAVGEAEAAALMEGLARVKASVQQVTP